MNVFGLRLAVATGFVAALLLTGGHAAEVTPRAVQDALPALDDFAERILKKTGVPAMAIAVVHKDKVIHLKGFGVRQAGAAARVDADTVFQLASVSKPITATVLAALVGEGKLRWDDRISDLDPGFRLADPWITREVTIRDLLCHRSGLPDHAGDLLEDVGYGRAEVLRRLRFERTGPFRTEFVYTNFGFTEAAVAGVRGTGKSWEDVAAEKLFRPLGMKSASFRYADYAAVENRARLHVRVDGKWIAKAVREPDPQAPAGGACASVRDMASWLHMNLAEGKFAGKPVISARALAETHRPQIISHQPDNPGTERAGFYGLGWNVSYDDDGRVRIGHSGAFATGAATTVTLLPSESLGIAVLTNSAPIGVPEAVSASFFDLVLKGKITTDWLARYTPAFVAMAKPNYGTTVDYSKPVEGRLPALPAEAYLGIYRNSYVGDLEIARTEKGLVLRIGPAKTEHALRHRDRDTFVYQPVGENAFGLSAVMFRMGPNRKASQVVLENFAAVGQGSFNRVEPKK